MKAGQAQVIVQFGLRQDPDYPQAPAALDLVTDPHARRLLETAFTEQEVGAPYVLGPKVPKAQVEIIERAFAAMIKDQAFLDDAKREDAAVSPMNAREAEAVVARTFHVPPDIVAELRRIARGQ
jgi:hypothetical protein